MDRPADLLAAPGLAPDPPLGYNQGAGGRLADRVRSVFWAVLFVALGAGLAAHATYSYSEARRLERELERLERLLEKVRGRNEALLQEPPGPAR